MTAITYAIGLMFLGVATFSSAWVVALVAALYYLQNDPASRLIEEPLTWYGYFASVQLAFGIYLYTLHEPILLVAVLACVVGASVTMLSSSSRIADGWFWSTYNYWWALTHACTFVPLLAYFFTQVK